MLTGNSIKRQMMAFLLLKEKALCFIINFTSFLSLSPIIHMKWVNASKNIPIVDYSKKWSQLPESVNRQSSARDPSRVLSNQELIQV